MKRNHVLPLAVLIAVHLAAGAAEGPLQTGGVVRLGTIADGRLKEVSGLVASRRHPGILWAHNDGTDGHLYAVRTNGQLLAVFQLQARVLDLEDIAIGPGSDSANSYLYLGDIGNNAGTRRSIQVHRLPEPELPANPTSTHAGVRIRPDTFTLNYPEDHCDAEALLADPISGDLYVVTEEPPRGRVYVVHQEQLRAAGAVQLSLVQTLGFANVSAGDISPDGRGIILRREAVAVLWMRSVEETVPQALARPPRPLEIAGPPLEPNGDSVAWHPDGLGYYTVSEGVAQPIFSFRIPSDVFRDPKSP